MVTTYVYHVCSAQKVLAISIALNMACVNKYTAPLSVEHFLPPNFKTQHGKQQVQMVGMEVACEKASSNRNVAHELYHSADRLITISGMYGSTQT